MSTRNITAFYRVLLIGFEGDAMFRQDIQDLLSTQFVKRVRRYSVALVFIHPVSSSLRLVSSFSVHLFPMLKQSWIARSVTFSVWVWGVWLPFTHGASMWGILELWWSDAQGSPVSILIPVSTTQSWWTCYRKQLSTLSPSHLLHPRSHINQYPTILSLISSQDSNHCTKSHHLVNIHHLNTYCFLLISLLSVSNL